MRRSWQSSMRTVYLSLQFRQLKNLDEILVAYGVEVEALAVAPRYEEPVKALTCFFYRKGASRTCLR